MADTTVTAASVRQVTGNPEDGLTLDAASGYTPANGDLVALSGSDAVDKCDATTANGLDVPFGVVVAWKKVRTTASAASYRVTVAFEGLIEGFSSLTPKTKLWSSATPGRIADADPTAAGVVGYPVGVAVTATAVQIKLPALAA